MLLGDAGVARLSGPRNRRAAGLGVERSFFVVLVRRGRAAQEASVRLRAILSDFCNALYAKGYLLLSLSISLSLSLVPIAFALGFAFGNNRRDVAVFGCKTPRRAALDAEPTSEANKAYTTVPTSPAVWDDGTSLSIYQSPLSEL